MNKKSRKFTNLPDAKKYQAMCGQGYNVYKWNRGKIYRYMVATYLQWLNY